jgi:hypothetical protein
MRARALAAALGAAVLLPSGAPGVGVPLVAVLVALAVAAHAPRSATLGLFGLLAVALAGLAALVDAQWVVAVDLVAALGFATVAVGGVRLAAPLAPLAGLRSARPLVPRLGSGVTPAVRGAVGGVLLVLPFGVLFWTGDALFAALAGSVPVPDLGLFPARVVTFAFVLTGSVALALGSRARVALPALRIRQSPVLEWALPLAALDLLFLVFVGTQGTALFADSDYVRRTTGLTYAEYARQGFWQLLGAGLLTLVVIGAASRVARAETPRQRLLLRALLAALASLTLVTVVSALHRLRLYEDAYGLSRLRLSAEAAAVWLGLVFCLVLAAGASGAVRRRLAPAVLALTGAGLIAFTLANPDGRIASRNVERWRDTGRIDVAYLQTLSADAVGAIETLPEPLRSRALAPIAARLARAEPWSSANLSRHLARRRLARDARSR